MNRLFIDLPRRIVFTLFEKNNFQYDLQRASASAGRKVLNVNTIYLCDTMHSTTTLYEIETISKTMRD